MFWLYRTQLVGWFLAHIVLQINQETPPAPFAGVHLLPQVLSIGAGAPPPYNAILIGLNQHSIAPFTRLTNCCLSDQYSTIERGSLTPYTVPVLSIAVIDLSEKRYPVQLGTEPMDCYLDRLA